jgi:hypothetical protein
MIGLDQFGTYQKGLELFDLVVEDAAALQRDARCSPNATSPKRHRSPQPMTSFDTRHPTPTLALR